MILGHQKQWQFLKKSAELGKLPHALLFCGQEQLGKKTLAVEFAKFLNSRPYDYSLANQGSRAKREVLIGKNYRENIEKGIQPDFILVEPPSFAKASEGKKGLAFAPPAGGAAAGNGIQIAQIRKLIDKLSFKPYLADLKIAVIDKAHSMTREAQSCFLKFLEEPKGKTLLILITEYPELLLPTILSRVQKIRFFPVKNTEIENYLQRQGIPETRAKELSSLSLGKPGAAMSFLSDSQKIENHKKLISDLIKISKSDLASRFQYAKSLGTSSNNLKEILDTWLRYLRSIFLSRFIGRAKTETFNRYSTSKLKEIIKVIQTTNFLLSTTNINPRLALEILLMRF